MPGGAGVAHRHRDTEPRAAVATDVQPEHLPAPAAGLDESPCAGPAASAGDVVARHLHHQAATFLRALGLRAEDEREADRLLLHSARRIRAALHTYGPLTDPLWAEPLCSELRWLSETLSREHQHAARLDRLSAALHRLAAGATGPRATEDSPAPGPVAMGAARAGALLERQLTLARNRAHSAALQALGSSRFHALADAVAVLASEVPLAAAAAGPACEGLVPLADQAHRRLAEAAAALPLTRAGLPYNADTVQASLGPDLTGDLQDAPWHQVRILLRLSRYAHEVYPGGTGAPHDRLDEAARMLERHRESARSASAAASAARTPRIAPATAYALGILHADQRREVEAARFAFARLWQRSEHAGAS